MERIASRIMVYVLLCAAFCGICRSETLTGYVIAVSDGDTIRVLDAEKKQHRIRFYGIDAPESRQAYGQRAKQYLADIVHNKNVRVEYTEKDKYGRIVGTVFLGNMNVNLEMVKAGFAWHYVYYAKKSADIAAAQEAARKAKLGLWADSAPIPPWEYRRSARVK